MIYRRTFEIETVGSRATHDLRPKLSDELPQGLNYRVHSYDAEKGTCIVEVWCSDHELLPLEHRKRQQDLESLDSRPFIKKTLSSPNPSAILARLSVSAKAENVGKGKGRIPQIDRAKKKLTLDGRELDYLRSKKSKDTSGDEIEEFVLDEG